MTEKAKYHVLRETSITMRREEGEEQERTVYDLVATLEANGEDQTLSLYLDANPDDATSVLVVVPLYYWRPKRPKLKAARRAVYEYEDA